MATINRCPHCGGSSIKIKRETGCFWIVFLFFSMGLGFIMYPFLPKTAECRDCGTKWKV